MSVSRNYIDGLACCSYKKYKPDPNLHMDYKGYNKDTTPDEEQIGAEQYMGKLLIKWRLKKLNDKLHEVDKVGVPIAKHEYKDCMAKGAVTPEQCKATYDSNMDELGYERDEINSQITAMKVWADKYRFI